MAPKTRKTAPAEKATTNEKTGASVKAITKAPVTGSAKAATKGTTRASIQGITDTNSKPTAPSSRKTVWPADTNTTPPKGSYHPRATDTVIPGLIFVHSTEPTRNRHIYKTLQQWSPKGKDDVKPRKGLAGYIVVVGLKEDGEGRVLKRAMKCTSLGCGKCGREARAEGEEGAVKEESGGGKGGDAVDADEPGADGGDS